MSLELVPVRLKVAIKEKEVETMCQPRDFQLANELTGQQHVIYVIRVYIMGNYREPKSTTKTPRGPHGQAGNNKNNKVEESSSCRIL